MKKIFIIAGEASGDYLGSLLMRDILELDRDVEFYGVGGDFMLKAGLKQFFSISELSIIGIWEAVKKIFHVKRLIDKTVEKILNYKPDAIVTIDSSGFNYRVLKRVKKLCPKIKTIHYVAPPVWAWRRWRAKSLYKFIDKLLVLFPFEEKIFSHYNLNTVFVGHPIASDPDFENKNEIERFRSGNFSPYWVCTMLPGSRMSELERHLPIFEKVSEIMGDDFSCHIPVPKNLEAYVREKTKTWKHKPIVSSSKSEKVDAFYLSNVAIAASGTVTLELLRTGLPFVCVYKTSFLTALLVRFLITIDCVCIVNILRGKKFIPELLQNECVPTKIFEAMMYVMYEENAVSQRKEFKKVLEIIGAPKEKCAAQEVLAGLG